MFDTRRFAVHHDTRTMNMVRVVGIKRNPVDWQHGLVDIVNIKPNGRCVPNTRRTVYMDSLRRWYI